MTFIFRNRTIFWDISKWNRGQKKWDKGSILLRLYLFIQLKTQINSLPLFLMSCLYYFKWNNEKYRTFDIGCIVKWCGKINKVVFWGAKS